MLDCGTIPESLLLRDRQILSSSDIKNEDELYRRVPHGAYSEIEGWNSNFIRDFPLSDCSVHLKSLCDSPNDVLRIFPSLENPMPTKYFHDESIATAVVDAIRGILLPNGNDPDTIITYDIIHSPCYCMYPHCDIMALRNGIQIPKSRVPKSMKDTIRRRLAKEFKPLQ